MPGAAELEAVCRFVLGISGRTRRAPGAGNLESTTKEKIGGFYTIGVCLCEGTCVAGSYSAMAIRFGNSSTMVTFTAFGVPFEVDKRYELVRQLGQARCDL